MVKLIWDTKADITGNLEKNKNQFKNRFKPLNDLSYSGNLGIKEWLKKESWRNKLFWGENKEVIFYLLNNFEGKIDLIYIDPPFFSGTNYHIKIKGPDKTYEDIAYFDHWEKDLDSYLQMLYERIILFRRLLSDKGLLFIHLDWHASHYIRLILDELFGQDHFVNNIVWYYYNKYSAGKRNLPRAHDDILIYSNTNSYTFNELRIPRKKPRKQLKRKMVDGVLKNVKDKNGHVVYRIVTDKKMDDVWRIPCMQPASKEWTGYPTQKHHDLLERIIKLGSNKGDLVADFFCGSGTTLLAAEKLNRRWIGSDISEYSIYLTFNRMREISSQPFETFTIPSKEKRMLIESGFFQKDLKIKRKK